MKINLSNNLRVRQIGPMICLNMVLLMTTSCSKPERPSISLHSAAEQGNLEQMQRHLYWGCDVNAANSGHDTPLGLAAKNGHVEVVKLLISKGADIKKSGAFYYAASENQSGIIDALIASGADINSKNADGYTLLHEAAKNREHPELTTFLISKGASVDAQSNDKSTPLHIAALNCNRGACEVLISKGARVNTRTDKGQTPLHLACQLFANPDTLELLLSKGADVNARDNDGQTPLHLAASSIGTNSVAATKVLLARRAKVDAVDRKGYEPVHDAQAMKKYDLVKMLLEARR
jgi:ankyrin repeat protein